jgi:hypothetical protein
MAAGSLKLLTACQSIVRFFQATLLTKHESMSLSFILNMG